MFDKGIFGGMFDFNGDGKLDSFEKAAEFSFFMEMMSESKKSVNNTSDVSSDSSDSTDIEDALDDAVYDIDDFDF